MPKEILFSKAVGPEALEFVDSSIPIPAENEVVVEMKAAGLNRSEYMFLTGTYVFEPSFPSRLGTEGAGIIYSVGSKVSSFKKGDAVCITPNILPYEYGVIGEYVKVPEEAIVFKPTSLSFEESASIWMSLSTAYYGLVLNGGLKAHVGQTVLVDAASSSLGVAVIQVAKKYGAKVIATSRTFEKELFLKEIGADYVIATQEEDLVEKVREYTEGRGFDIGFEMVAGDMISKFAEAAALHATILLSGLLSMEVPIFPFFPMTMKNLTFKSFHVVLHLFRNRQLFEEVQKHILDGIKSEVYFAKIDRIFSFEKVPEAYKYLAGSSQMGKVVVKF